MSSNKPLFAAALSFALTFSTAAMADDQAEMAIEKRQENFENIGGSFKTVRDELRSGDADMAKIKAAADTIASLARNIKGGFPAGTGPETGVETEALPAIWQDKTTFEGAADKLVTEADKFAELAASGDASKIMGGVRGLGGACKNCHDQFRLDDD